MDWNNPTKDTTYLDVLDGLKSRDVDALTLCKSAPTNPPIGALKFNRITNGFEEWDGSSWVPLVHSVASGGTGGNTQALARTGLGLGSISTQNSNNVTITGGSISGLSNFTLACSIIMGNNLYDLGSAANPVRRGYFSSGLVVPVGTDKYVPA